MNFLPRLIQSQQAGGDQSIHFEPIAATLLADFIRYSVGYGLLTQAVKMWLVRKAWI